jgi:hypothetical protein
MNTNTSCPTAIELRDRGINKVMSREATWAEHAHEAIARYPHDTATAEELRAWVLEQVGAPAHFNATGGMIMRCVRKGLLTNLNNYVVGKNPAGHGRRIATYRINKQP